MDNGTRHSAGLRPVQLNRAILARVRAALDTNPSLTAADIVGWGLGLQPAGAERYLKALRPAPDSDGSTPPA